MTTNLAIRGRRFGAAREAALLTTLMAVLLTACSKEAAKTPAAMEEPTAITNRVDIPIAVRRNLGITFAKVESRAVARTLRLPGRFELLPTARREYRSPVAGRVELLVEQFARVEAGTPIALIDSADWRGLGEEIIATRAKVASMVPLREAHRVHESSLAEKVRLWEDRLQQLESIRAAGGATAAQMTDAQATLIATRAELADVMEKDATLESDQREAESRLRALEGRVEALARGAGVSSVELAARSDGRFELRAVEAGIIESIATTSGGLAETNALVVTVVVPERVRFQARALQSDLGRLRDGLAARIVPPQGGTIPQDASMDAALSIGPAADARDRTIALYGMPRSLASWARDGVSGHLEVTLAGGGVELAIPMSAVIRDGGTPILFRRDPANPDKAIRLEADLGVSDGRWIVVQSGVKAGDEIVLGGNYQLMLATGSSMPKGGHFHSDGTFHEGDH